MSAHRFIEAYYFLHVSVLSVCLCMYHVPAWCLQKPEEDNRVLGNGIPDGYELPCVW